MKKSRVLAEEVQAEVPYEETRLAKAAAPARRRLAIFLLLGAVGFVIEAALARDAWMVAGVVALAATAWGVWFGRLAGIVAAGLAALLAIGIPLGFLGMSADRSGESLALVFVVVWGLAMLPDLVTLVRDAELQSAYGRWAARE